MHDPLKVKFTLRSALHSTANGWFRQHQLQGGRPKTESLGKHAPEQRI